jgi:Sulfatase
MVLLAWLAGMALSVCIDRLTEPTPALRRPIGAWLLHFGVCALVFAAEFLVFRRPWFAAANVLAWQLLIVLISNAKFHSLREPFIYQDFEYFLDAIKHPRLYLPFLGAWRAAVAAIAFVAAVAFGLLLETPVDVSGSPVAYAICAIALLMVALLLLTFGARQPLRVTHAPADDTRRLGLIACMWQYRSDERATFDVARLPMALNIDATIADGFRPNIVAIQSESFFDVRRLSKSLRPSVFTHWDRARDAAAAQGRVRVAAWGANTVRTEFSFLSGLAPDMLGVHRFNPYRKLAHLGIATLASRLRSLGYKTICVHPYPATFYTRNVIFPKLGFDEFIDISGFTDAPKVGPYVGDVDVAKKIEALLADAPDGVFIFAITMENHGPLHWEQIAADEVAALFTEPLPGNCEELAVYARHLANADAMLGTLMATMQCATTPHWICQYGDHVPIMPSAYAVVGEPDGMTDYVIWANDAALATKADDARDLGIAELAELLLARAFHHRAHDHADGDIPNATPSAASS